MLDFTYLPRDGGRTDRQNRKTDGQTYRQTDRQRHTDKQTTSRTENNHMDKHPDGQTDRHTDGATLANHTESCCWLVLLQLVELHVVLWEHTFDNGHRQFTAQMSTIEKRNAGTSIRKLKYHLTPITKPHLWYFHGCLLRRLWKPSISLCTKGTHGKAAPCPQLAAKSWN